MILFAFSVELAGEWYEAAGWGVDVNDAFGTLQNRLQHQTRQHAERSLEWGMLNALSKCNEWEYSEIATFDGPPPLVWWLGMGEA